MDGEGGGEEARLLRGVKGDQGNSKCRVCRNAYYRNTGEGGGDDDETVSSRCRIRIRTEGSEKVVDEGDKGDVVRGMGEEGYSQFGDSAHSH